MLGGQDFSEILAPEWLTLADAWAGYAADPNYVFNDLHAAMAFAKAEDRLLDESWPPRRRKRESPCSSSTRCASPSSEGMPQTAAFAQQDYERPPRGSMSLAPELGEAGCCLGGWPRRPAGTSFQTGTLETRPTRTSAGSNPPVTRSALTPTHERGTEA